MVLLIGLAISNLNGQFCQNPPPCLVNGELESNSGQQFGNMNSTANSTVNGWGISHGSPSLAAGFSNGGIYMWSRTVLGVANGEGIFSCHDFQQGRTYFICFRVRNTSTLNQGNLFVRAVRGLNTNGNTIIPAVPTTSQIIHDTHIHDTNWVQINVTYTPNADYDGIWIYPFSPVDFVNGIQYELAVDDIRISEFQPNTGPITATVANPLTKCDATTLTLTNVPTGATVNWTPAAGLSSTTGTSVTASPCVTTRYRTSVNTQCIGCNSAEYTVVVNPLNLSIASTQDPVDWCSSTTLRVNGVPAGATVNWFPSAGLNSTHGAVVTASPCSTTTYTAVVTCANDCPPDSVSYTVNVTPPTGGLANSALTVQCGDPFKLEYVPIPSCAMFDWFDPNGNLISNNNDVNVTSAGPNHSGIYTLTVTYANGCTENLTATVDVVNCCRAIANFDEGPDCNPVRFTDMSTGISTPVSWFWEFGDGATSTRQNPNHLYVTQLGPVEVCLTVTYKIGTETCCDRICKDINVCDFGCAAVADFKYSFPSFGQRTVQFNDISVGSMGACTVSPAPSPYHWDFGDGNTSTAQSPNHTYGGPGTYNVCFTVTYCTYTLGGGVVNTCTDTYCETITIQ